MAKSTNPYEPPQDGGQAGAPERQGRVVVLLVCGFLFSFVAFNTVVSLVMATTDRWVIQMLRALVYLVLCGGVWLGARWARIALGVLGVVAVLTTVVGAALNLVHGLHPVLVAVVGLGHGLVAWAMLFSRTVRQFMEGRRAVDAGPKSGPGEGDG